jgi:hypothetical protein
MRTIMNRVAMVLALGLLSACQGMPGNSSPHGGTAPKTSQAAGAVQAKNAGQAGQPAVKSEGGTQQATPDGAKVGGTGVTTAQGEAPGTTESPLLNPPVDRSKKLEYAEVYVDLKNPQGQKALVPYLMKPEEWMIVKVENLGPTYKKYKFQRVGTSDGKRSPEIDPLMPKKPDGTSP